MSQPQSNRAEDTGGEVKLLPGGEVRTTATSTITASTAPAKQLPDLPKDELEHFAEEFGLDPADYRTRQALVAAIHERRQTIAINRGTFEIEIVGRFVHFARQFLLH